MNNFSNPMPLKKHFHFIGICGTAMGSVAVALKEEGHTVTGSDSGAYPPMSTFLEAAGIEVREGFAPGNIPAETDVVVIGNAMSRGDAEVESVLDRRLLYTSLPEVLKHEFLRGRRNLVVTGTHGKTTTTSMLAWILESSGNNPNYLIGGIPANFGQGCFLGGGEFVVLEGDEYDTAFFDKRSKFIHYLPEIVIVNNLEFDHADIFDDLDAIKKSFRQMLNIVPGNGRVLVNADETNCLDVVDQCPAPVSTVGFAEGADFRIVNPTYDAEGSEFTIHDECYRVPMAGEFNVRNAAMATVAALQVGVTPDAIHAGLLGFEGIARRQQPRGEAGGIRVVDDFAHHPTALAGAIAALRQHDPDARIWALFEPRSNTSRRNIHQQAFAEALALADFAVVAAVDHPEKVAAEDRLDTDRLVTDIKARGGSAFFGPTTEAIISHVDSQAEPGDVIAVFSNGGFDGIHLKILAALEARKSPESSL